MKREIKDLSFRVGSKIINRIYPEDNWKHSWRNEYTRLRWWFVCSDQYKEIMKPWFDNMLLEYKGRLWNRGKLLKLDYWLCWIFLGAEPDDYFDFEFFRKGWRWRNHHITKQRLNFIDPIFNDKENVHILGDKTEFYNIWNSYLKRRWCIPQNVSFEEFQSLFGNVSRILVKRASSFGGHGIYAIDTDASNLKNTYEKLHRSEEKIVVEEFVHQKGFLNDVYPMALNPLRVTTIRIGAEAEVCYAFYTSGCGGTIISNDCIGGICFPVDSATGLMGVGQGRSTNGHYMHPDTGIKVAGQYVPDWQKIKDFACEVHRLAPENIRLVGWDICWSDGELSIIEGNNTPGFPELTDRHENQWKMIQGYLDAIHPDT